MSDVINDVPRELLERLEHVTRNLAPHLKCHADLTALLTAQPQASAVWQRTQSLGVPEGYVLVPQQMLLDATSLEALVFVGGGQEEDGKPTYLDCVMWVGEVQDDDGSLRHGLHAFCTECEEEGSTTLAEFAAAPAQPAAQGGMGETIEPCTDLNHHERYRAGWNACLARHQRITAAMAAEVERHRAANRDMQQMHAADRYEIDRLRAELAEVKGREAVPVAWHTEDHLEDKSATTYRKEVAERWRSKGWPIWPLYASQPASPDVEGLVKALEATLKLGRGTSGRIILESEDEEALRTALSTWRQAQEVKS